MHVQKIGDKIKEFRLSAGLSQLDLELLIDSSPGAVSKIENGKTNPTKETIINIANALDLQSLEIGYLLGISLVDPTKEEIVAAIKHVESMLTPEDSFCYLLDNKSRVVEISTGFKNLLNSLNIDTDKLVGKCIVEVLFDPNLGVRGIIDPVGFITAGKSAVAILHQEKLYLLKEKWWSDLFARLDTFPDFTECWEDVQKNHFDVLQEKNRTVPLNLGDRTIEMVYTPIYLYPDPRFGIIQYLPKNPNKLFG